MRRQFLASPTSSLVVFLSRGLKVTDCLELEEMTESTTCKVRVGEGGRWKCRRWRGRRSSPSLPWTGGRGGGG